MKRLLFILCALVLAACGGNDATNTADDTSPATTSTTVATPTSTVPAIEETTTTQPTAVEETTTTTAGREAVQPALGIEQNAGASFDEDGLNTDTVVFVALDDPRMVPVSEVDWIDDDDIVLGFVHASGEAHAFPTAQMSFHHVANITVAGTPYLVTY